MASNEAPVQPDAGSASTPAESSTSAGWGSADGGGSTGYLRDLAERWMSTRTQLVVWDFDMTVLKTHAFGEGVEVEDVAQRWREDVCDLDFFKASVEVARSRGIEVGIASYGRHEVIAEYMKQIWAKEAQPPFTSENIITPVDLGQPDGTHIPEGKPQMLDLLCDQTKVTDKKAVVFFDDDPLNVQDCIMAGFQRAFHVPEGFSRKAVEALQESSAERKVSCVVS